MEEKPQLQFSPIDGLPYDIDEIDHPMYMFSHECVGCVILTASAELSHYGKSLVGGQRAQGLEDHPHDRFSASAVGRVPERVSAPL